MIVILHFKVFLNIIKNQWFFNCCAHYILMIKVNYWERHCAIWNIGGLWSFNEAQAVSSLITFKKPSMLTCFRIKINVF